MFYAFILNPIPDLGQYWQLTGVDLLKAQLRAGSIHGYGVGTCELSAEDSLGDRCFKLALGGPLQWAGS